ncbi:hypothetical protein RHMOL_Rhmol10G0291000 [Rhododendron molle]|uniref:Uncharacterized protein n=1 Tax=Rhododendron molle TaxID=49168 RepID=A0ACC0M8I5_RHOML|nr:hypothetical protein RHMOL_Rhmol10G0291000 [Rhododendron molle]
MIWLTATVGRMSWAAAVAEEAIWNFDFGGICPSSAIHDVLVVLEDPQMTFCRWGPLAGDDVVAGGFRGLRDHPEPEDCSERNDGVGYNQVWVG